MIHSDFVIPSDFVILSDFAIPSDFVIPGDFVIPAALGVGCGPSDFVVFSKKSRFSIKTF